MSKWIMGAATMMAALATGCAVEAGDADDGDADQAGLEASGPTSEQYGGERDGSGLTATSGARSWGRPGGGCRPSYPGRRPWGSGYNDPWGWGGGYYGGGGRPPFGGYYGGGGRPPFGGYYGSRPPYGCQGGNPWRW